LKSYHTFSFADYHDPAHMGVGPLRVINEDTVTPNRGFGTHSHRDMEIISYVLEGRLAHKDSLGHSATIGPGMVQRISAGTGIEHSEFNPSGLEVLHFLQIWITPNRRGVAPRYDEAEFDVCSEVPVVRTLVTPDGADGSVSIYQDARVSVALLPKGGDPILHRLGDGRLTYLHMAKGTATVGSELLRPGDAMTLVGDREVTFSHADDAQVLIFDLPGS
jgi:redox-sensitive bicupin YhaK (pirin superfamily)